MTPEQAKTIVLKRLPSDIKLGPFVTDYKGYYVFGIIDPRYIGHSAMGVNKTTGAIKEFNYMDQGLIEAGMKQHPEYFTD